MCSSDLWGQRLKACIAAVNAYVVGWIGFFGICTEKSLQALGSLDAHIRRRLRALQLRDWRTKRGITRRLIRLGVKPETAWSCVYRGRRGLWALSHCPAVDRGLCNAHMAKQGLGSIVEQWRRHRARTIVALGAQLTLGLG